MRSFFLLGAVLVGCDVSAPEDVRGVAVGEPTPPDTLTDTSANAYSCDDGPAFPDMWAGLVNPADVTDVPYDFDAGIEDALDAVANNGPFPVEITDAVVANFTTSNGDVDTLWIADKAGGLMSYNVTWGLSADDIAPGDTISFSITDGTVYYGLPEITDIDGTPTITGHRDEIYVVNGNAETITTETHLSQNIAAYGELVKDEGSCGSSQRCFAFGYGDNVHTLRVSTDLGFQVGDCVQVAMPLSIYYEEEQYSVENNNWVSLY